MRKSISRVFGRLAALKFPKPIQSVINKCYIEYFSIPMHEFKHYSEYTSLLDLFIRRLEKERVLDDGFISPCDARILSSGLSSNNKAFSIKGKDYDIAELLGFTPDEDFKFLNLYLSPKDYHNYHSPCDMQVLSARYFCAELFSVSVSALQKYDNLYSRNERVVLKCKSDEHVFYMVFVGAVNVGKMEFDFDLSIKTNMKDASDFYKEYEDIHLKKGQMLGRFLMGSTILILSPTLEFECTEGAVRFGQKIAK